MLTPQEFYKDSSVRGNIAQYCGGNVQTIENNGTWWESNLMAEYIVGFGPWLNDHLGKPFKSFQT